METKSVYWKFCAKYCW